MPAAVPVLVDSGVLIAYYDQSDPWFKRVRAYFESSKVQFITTEPCATEVLWLLRSSRLVQNEFLADLSKQLYICEPLRASDYVRISELNIKYSNMEADFPDLSLIAISERLDIARIASLDDDFDIYRRYGRRTFQRVFPV